MSTSVKGSDSGCPGSRIDRPERECRGFENWLLVARVVTSLAHGDNDVCFAQAQTMLVWLIAHDSSQYGVALVRKPDMKGVASHG